MYRKLGLSIFSAIGLFASSSPAWSWGCTAVASDGAYGYSYDWPDEQDAELKALQECDKRATSDDCQTQECDPEG